MIVSMTGFGQGKASSESTSVVTEIRTVNHRFLDFSFKLPRVLQLREREIRESAKRKLTRGRVYITMTIESETPARNVSINDAVMKQYLSQLRGFVKTNGLDNDVDINTLVMMPDAVATREDEVEVDSIWPLASESLTAALDSCAAMRGEEGSTLEADIIQRMKAMAETVAKVEKLAPDISRKHAETFRKRVDQLIGDVAVDSDRLANEIAIMADRLDITEELIRLRSHESQFNKTLSAGGEVSKKLTYLLQEMHRESSTIGAKASDSEVIQLVVLLKEETEKLREQIQNIE